MPFFRKRKPTPEQLALRKRSHERHAMRPLEGNAARSFQEGGKKFSRVYSSPAGKVYGVSSSTNAKDHSQRIVTILEVNPANRKTHTLSTAILTFSGKSIEISDFGKLDRLVLLPSYHGLDLIRPVLDEATHIARERGLTSIRLEVKSKKLVNYYRRFGFEVYFFIPKLYWWMRLKVK